MDNCMLMHPWINGALRTLQGRCAETTQVSVRYGTNAGTWLIQPDLQNPDIPLESGQRHYQESLEGHSFRIASPSFFQVNTPQAERMVEMVREGLKLRGTELLVDAYAGVGAFAALLAPYVQRVVAIEESLSAVKDAAANIQGISNVEVLRGKVEEALPQMGQRPDAVVLDPPRTGCHPRALEALSLLGVPRVAYVSCDPSTLARDLGILCRGRYQLEEVRPVDMFPQTHHVEAIAFLALSQREAPQLTLASRSPRRKEILLAMGFLHEVRTPLVDETPVDGEGPEDRAERLALLKAREVASRRGQGIVVGADTLVIHGRRVLGKPHTPSEAEAMLRSLWGKIHRVVTGIAVVDAATGREVSSHRVSSVTMRTYTDAEVQAYVASGGPVDKAGAYAVQDALFHPAERVEGCYLNVVGLPVCTLVELLGELGVDARPEEGWEPPKECEGCPLRQQVGR